MQEDPKKLAKLKRKLDAIAAAQARKAQKKAAARAVARQTVKPSTPTQKKKHRLAAKLRLKMASAKRPNVAKKVKRKLNLSPERRAQLAAAMKARWAAKRAAPAEANAQNPTGQDPAVGQVPQSP